MPKIQVRYSASKTSKKETFDLVDDLGYSEEEWGKLSLDRKQEELMDAVENDQPYWAIENFELK